MTTKTVPEEDPPLSNKAIIIAISGPSSSGKTTLSRFLRSCLPHSFILHEDDFFLPEAQLPRNGDQPDWDSPASLDVPRLASALAHIRTHGELPPWLESHEDQNTVGPSTIAPPEVLEEQRRRLVQALNSRKDSTGHVKGYADANADTNPPTKSERRDNEEKDENQGTPKRIICILDGFLLYPPSILDSINAHLDAKLFLPVRHAAMKSRREARAGYVTVDGFWEDPPGYVDDVVWPNYEREHRFLFEKGDVEGTIDQRVVDGLGIRVWEGWEREGGLEDALVWTVGVVCEVLATAGHGQG